MFKFSLRLPVFATRPREVVILPDHRFFVRSVTLAEEAEASLMAEQIELALEGLAPFPVAQMWWGYWTKPGYDRALVFAAYQNRFTAEETRHWAGAEWVVPRLATLLADATEPPAAATTWILRAADGLTALHFGDDSGVPTSARSVALGEEPAEADVQAVRDRLIRESGGSKVIRDLDDVPVEAGLPGSDELIVRREDAERKISLLDAEMLDVRENADLAARRRARVRDTWLWRTMVASLGVLVLAGMAELALWGSHYWSRSLHRQIQLQAPIVAEIETADRLANRVDELRTKRLRPFEMIAIADGPRPEAIIFLRTAATGLYSLEIEAETNDAPAINAYVSALQELGQTEAVQILNLDQRGSLSTVRLLVTFTHDAFQVTDNPESPA